MQNFRLMKSFHLLLFCTESVTHQLHLSKLPVLRDFVDCAVIWCDFAVRYFSMNELSVMLETLMNRVTSGKVCELLFADGSLSDTIC